MAGSGATGAAAVGGGASCGCGGGLGASALAVAVAATPGDSLAEPAALGRADADVDGEAMADAVAVGSASCTAMLAVGALVLDEACGVLAEASALSPVSLGASTTPVAPPTAKAARTASTTVGTLTPFRIGGSANDLGCPMSGIDASGARPACATAAPDPDEGGPLMGPDVWIEGIEARPSGIDGIDPRPSGIDGIGGRGGATG